MASRSLSVVTYGDGEFGFCGKFEGEGSERVWQWGREFVMET